MSNAPRWVSPESELLATIEKHIRRYVVLPAAAYLPMSLWVVATYAAQHFDCFPYVALLSAAKRSGKTRLLEVLETLVRAPYRGTAPSPAALYRMLETGPTLMLDEVEIFNGRYKSETTQILLAVLNVGHRKGGSIPRCEGPKQEIRQFRVYGPKLFAAIGRLPDTLMDRSIVIHMTRRKKDQQVERFRHARAVADARPIQTEITGLVKAHQGDISEAYECAIEEDMGFLTDRDADLWAPLFAICAVFDPPRLRDARMNAALLSKAKADDDVDESSSMTLLRDIRNVWPGTWEDGEEKCETALLIEKLKAVEESPWAEYQLTPRKLARMLRPFGVWPRNIRIGDRSPKGYLRAELKTAFDPYLPDLSATSATEQ